jgi:hypothetical protein
MENGTIKLRANNEKNWPSFLYPEDTVYNELELDKGLFRGHVFLRVSSPFLKNIISSSSNFFRVCALYLQGNPQRLPAIEQHPNLPRQKCTACGKYSLKQSHMLRSK